MEELRQLLGGSGSVPRVSWEQHHRYMDENWHAGQHVSIWAPTGEGKSHLIRHGLLPLWQSYPVLIVDAKGDKRTLHGCGQVCRAMPNAAQRLKWRLRKADSPRWLTDPEWFRLQLPEYKWSSDPKQDNANWQRARNIAGTAIDACYRQGRWLLVLDEPKALTDGKPPALSLGAPIENNYQRGRDRPLTIVAGTQSPSYAPPAMYDQARFHYYGRVSDLRRQFRLGEIAGDTDLLREVLPTLRKHEFLATGPDDHMEIVRAPAGREG